MLFSFTLSPSKKDVAGGRCIQTQQRSSYSRLAAAGFSYQTEGFSRLDGKETPSTAFKGVVFINPVLIGKYCFKSRTSTRYSLLFLLLRSLSASFFFLHGCLYIQPAGCEMTVRHLHFRRLLFDTDLHRFLAAWAKCTALWHI